MTNNPPHPSKGSINSSKLPSLTRESTAPAAGDAKQKRKRERAHGGVGGGGGQARAKTNYDPYPWSPSGLDHKV